MPIVELHSERQRRLNGLINFDVYTYDDVPAKVRRQIIYVLETTIGTDDSNILQRYQPNTYWKWIETTFLRETGMPGLPDGTSAGERVRFMLRSGNVGYFLDFLELAAKVIQDLVFETETWRNTYSANQHPADAIEEINHRLRMGGVGFQIEGAHVIRVDSKFIHAEVVKPVFSLLSGPDFEGPQQEFLEAHRHYRAGENRQAIAMAANALESTFKTIFAQKRWDFTDVRISGLVKVARTNHLWPDYLDNSFDQLVATLQSGLPKIRDNDASHGQGAETREVPPFIAAYALHLSASAIVFVVQAAASN